MVRFYLVRPRFRAVDGRPFRFFCAFRFFLVLALHLLPCQRSFGKQADLVRIDPRMKTDKYGCLKSAFTQASIPGFYIRVDQCPSLGRLGKGMGAEELKESQCTKDSFVPIPLPVFLSTS